MPSPFEALIDDLAALRDRRQIEANARAARHAQRDTVSRATAPRRLAKAAPPAPAPAPDFDRIARQQERIAADLERSRMQAQKQAIRAHLATLMAAARAGRLSAHDAALLDVYRGQALSLGLEP